MTARRKREGGLTFELRSNVDRMNEAVEAGATRALNRIAIDWHAAARQSVPVDTGRLRASIAFTTPTVHALHSERFPGNAAEGKPGGTITYLPDPPERLTTAVGTNVEYAQKVHEHHPTMSKFIEEPAELNQAKWQGWLEEEIQRATEGGEP
jgi:hypothetical protein